MRFLLYCGVILLEGDLVRFFLRWQGLDEPELSLESDDKSGYLE